MFIIIWEYKVKPDCTEAFEHLYGSNGEWALLFRRFPGYQGTELVRKNGEPNCYLTIDRWQSAEWYEKFLAAAKEDYKRIDKKGEALTVEEMKIGSFDGN